MQTSDDYAAVSDLELKPVYISLGLPKTALNGNEIKNGRLFDAVIDGGTQFPNCVWFFRKEECYRFDLKTGRFADGPMPMAEAWGGATFPLTFSSGIDCGVWGGETYPNLFYFYKDNYFARYNAISKSFDVNPELIANGWASSRGNWFGGSGPSVALHGIGTRYGSMLHIFRGNQYLRHNLNNGLADAGPMPIYQEWNLPEPFAEGIDMAFYGAGEESERIYFIKDNQFVLYDSETRQVVKSEMIEKRFPAITRFNGGPQLFIVENYEMRTYAGPTEGGEVIDTKSLPPGASEEVVVEYEIVSTSASTITQSLLQSTEQATEANFYEQLKTQNDQSSSRDQYDYGFDAAFHGDASANGPFGGEVNANVNAKGNTNTVRDNFAQSAFKSIDQQLKATAKSLQSSSTQGMTSSSTQKREKKTEKKALTNPSQKVRTWEFRHQRQKYVALLILRKVQLAYADGSGPSQIVELGRMDQLLNEHIPVPKDRAEVRELIIRELAAVSDYQGVPCSMIAEITPAGTAGQSVYISNGKAKSDYAMTKPDGTEQTITVDGIVKEAKEWLVPLYNLIAIEK